MIGPDDTVLGGITSVQQTLRKYWHQDSFPMRYLGIYCHGSKMKKLWVAIRSMLVFVWWSVWWRPQIVHVHFSYKAGFYRESLFMLVSRLFGYTTFAHAHAPDFEGFYQQQWSIARSYIRFVLNHTNKLIVLSSMWQTYYQSLAPTTHIVTLYNPVEVPKMRPQLHAKPIILTLGELGQRKGTYTLLKAIPKVLKQFPMVEFWLGGNGDIDAIREIIRDENLTQHVKLLGWVTGHEKHAALDAASIYVLPSYHEALPVSVLEAMAYSIPIVTTSIGSISDVLQHENHAMLVEVGDILGLASALITLLDDRNQRQILAQNAYTLIMHEFTPEIILNKLENLYDAHL